MKTAHDKLIEMGYKHERIEHMEFYEKEEFDYIWFSRTEKNYRLGEVYVDIELSRILTEYLEELKENRK